MQDTIVCIQSGASDHWLRNQIITAAITLLVSIIVFFLSQKYFRHLDKKRSNRKFAGYLQVIGEEVKRNLNLLCQLHAYYYVRVMPTFTLSSFITDEMFSNITAVCGNFKLLNDIFQNYFEYKHIQNRMSRISGFYAELAEIEAQRPINHEKQHVVQRAFYVEINGTLRLIEANIAISFKTYNRIAEELSELGEIEKLEKLSREYVEGQFKQYQKDPLIMNAAETIRSGDAGFDLTNRLSLLKL